MGNLGGHDLPSLLEAFEGIDHDRPVVFIAYTVKGIGLPLAGHKDNHAGLLTPAQMEGFRASANVRPGHEWDRFEGLGAAEDDLERFLEDVPFNRAGTRRFDAARRSPATARSRRPKQAAMSTQQGFGLILNELARSGEPLADRIVTTSPDVTVSTNLGPWVNRRGLFARQEMKDLFKSERIPSTYTWDFSPKGQHIELGIAEMNLFLLLSALGLSHSLFGERLIPIGTLYDPFIARGLDALNYACYQDARFILVGDAVGRDAGAGGRRAPVDRHAADRPRAGRARRLRAGLRRRALGHPALGASTTCRRDAAAGERGCGRAKSPGCARRPAARSTCASRPARIDQLGREMTPALAQDIIDGAYWLRKPGPNAQVVVAYTGALAPEAIEAVGLMAEDRRDVGLLAVTSADRLNAGWTAAQRARERGLVHARSHIERLLADVPSHCGLVTVLDGHPATLAWLGSVMGHRTRSLGVEHFGQTGTIQDLYRHHGIDAQGIVAAAEMIAPGRPIRHLKALG